ncbi:MAG: DNA mismatch repair protein MutS [Rhodothermales bacterium]
MPQTAPVPGKKGQTPLMRQYYAIKERHPGTVLLFRMGDFYETFDTDAEKVHAVLGITLTKRSNGSASEVALAGFPHHALDTYLPKLVRAGFRVAICEQLEEPEKGKKIVKRDVVEIVTPGVAMRSNLQEPTHSTYLAAVHLQEEGRGAKSRLVCGVAHADVSTGEFKTAHVHADALADYLTGLNASEILCVRSLRDSLEGMGFPPGSISLLEEWVFAEEYASNTLKEHFQVHSLKGFGIEETGAGVTAAGALLHYVQDTQKGNLAQIRRLEWIDDQATMPLDVQTLRNLELVASSATGNQEGSLVAILDRTRSPMGARLLRSWLVRPLRSLDAIVQRQRVVDVFHTSRTLRDAVRDTLKGIGDLERIAVRIATGRAAPRDISGLRDALIRMPELVSLLEGAHAESLEDLLSRIVSADDIVARIESVLVDEPPAQLKDGGVIREGVSEELDELRALAKGGKEWLAGLQRSESERTGISSLKIGFNKVFGYYLEVTNAHKDKVPESWIRKQTLVNAERYITQELKEYEEKILGAEERLISLELSLFNELREDLAGEVDRVQANARILASIDVLSTFALVAHTNRFTRPLLHEGLDLEIEDGRHPVVESLLPPGEPFVPNSVRLSAETEQILIITGPNMAGKSVVLRQVGLIVLLAQIGAFVPAKRARIGLTDRIFTRVGASDNLAAGESTFLVEMNETANILNNATQRSLILLDEVGRGTSTFDGLSIAWSLVEYLHSHAQVAARTLFATHYHELNELEERLERVRNYRIQVQEHIGKVIFLRKLIRGGADHSYGIEVARMAGLPAEVLDRSREILNQLEQQDLEIRKDGAGGISERISPPVEGPQMSLFVSERDPAVQEVWDAIQALNPDDMTPLDALLLLSRLHNKTRES